MLAMAPTNPRCTIVTKIDTKAVHVTSLDKCSKCYRSNKKTIIIDGTVLDVEIGPKVTVLGRRRTFVVARFDLETWRWPPSTFGVSRSTLRNLLVLLLVVILGRGLMLPPRLILDTQPSHIQSLLKNLGASTRPFEWWCIPSGGCIANGWTAWPAAHSIYSGCWVGGGGGFIPSDGCIYWVDASTSYLKR